MSRSRSSTDISLRSESSTWRVWIGPGVRLGSRSTTKIDALGERERRHGPRSGIARRLHAAGGIKPRTLWIQALTEAGEDPEIRGISAPALRERARLHRRGLRRAQAAGGDRRRSRSRRGGVDLPRCGDLAPLLRRPARRPARTGRLRRRSPRNASAGSPAPSKAPASGVHSALEGMSPGARPLLATWRQLSPGAKRPFRGLGADRDLLPQIPILLAP